MIALTLETATNAPLAAIRTTPIIGIEACFNRTLNDDEQIA